MDCAGLTHTRETACTSLAYGNEFKNRATQDLVSGAALIPGHDIKTSDRSGRIAHQVAAAHFRIELTSSSMAEC